MKHLTFFKLLALVACLTSALSASAYDFSASYNGVTIYYNITSSTNKTVEVTYKEDGYYNYYGVKKGDKRYDLIKRNIVIQLQYAYLTKDLSDLKLLAKRYFLEDIKISQQVLDKVIENLSH